MDTDNDFNADYFLLRQAEKLVHAMDSVASRSLPQEIAKIVTFHSKGAAAAALASGWIPGVGGTAAIVIAAGFIWSMYGRIGAKIGLSFGKNILKSLASGVATNLAANVVGGIALTTAFSLIPGLGSIGASVIAGAICYAITLASGYLYLKIITNLFSNKVDLSTVSEQDLKDMAVEFAKDGDVQEVINEAKADFHRRNKQGEFK